MNFFWWRHLWTIEGKINPLHLSALGQLKGKTTLQLSNETSENCRTGFPWCFTTS